MNAISADTSRRSGQTDDLPGGGVGASVGILIADDERRVIAADKAVCDLFREPREALLGRPLLDLFKGEGEAEVICELLYGEPGKIERLRLKRESGDELVVEVSSLSARLPGQNLLLVRDLSAQIAFERERERIELEHRLSQRLEAVGQLAAGIAHEINTPIQFIGDSVRFLGEAMKDLRDLVARQRELCARAYSLTPEEIEQELDRAEQEVDLAYLDERAPAAIERVFDGVERVSTIVKAMKSFAHPSDQPTAPADLNEALETTLTVCRNEYKYVADIERELGKLPLVVCNLGDLNQVFLNLIVNAAQAIGEQSDGETKRGKIWVRSREDGDSVVIEIADDGPGIPEPAREHIWEPFFTTKEPGKGSGQGLAISRSIVERHSGTIRFESEPGKGTTFTLRIPIEPPKPEKESAAE